WFTNFCLPSTCLLPAPLASVSEQKTIVDKHNNLRRGVQPTARILLIYHMAHLIMTSSSPLLLFLPFHPASGCGENLYMASYKSSWSNVIQSWADEVKDFQYGPVNEPVFSFCAQVVWYRSNQISCAMAHCPNSNYKYFYVCHNFVYFYYSLPLPANQCPYADKYTNCAEVARQPRCSNSDVTSWCPAS
uniref:ShKT domain-containing protein n=1 Tax=Salmo trutta TaxID=8032 RepID=A0A674ERQ3_SALTR